jgi:hypothetical protein
MGSLKDLLGVAFGKAYQGGSKPQINRRRDYRAQRLTNNHQLS